MQGILKNIQKDKWLNLSFFVNSIGSSIILPVMILFQFGLTLSQPQILFLGSLKFWSHTTFSILIVNIVGKIDPKNGIFSSLIIKSLSFLILIFDQSYISCVISLIINGLGSSIFSISSKLYIKLVSQNISESFSIRHTIHNIGASISPLVLSISLMFSSSIVPIVSLVFTIFLTFSFLCFNLKSIGVGEKSNDSKSGESLQTINKNILFNVIITSLIFSSLYYIFETGLPLILADNDIKAYISPLMICNTVLIVFFQIPLYKYFSTKFGHESSLFISMLICWILYIPAVVFQGDIYYLVLLVIGISLLEMFFSTGIDTIISENSNKESAARLYTISSFCLAIGTSISGFLYEMDPVIYISGVGFLIFITFCQYFILPKINTLYLPNK